jgi:hypothetical protein
VLSGFRDKPKQVHLMGAPFGIILGQLVAPRGKRDVSQITLSGDAILLNPYMDPISDLPQAVSHQTSLCPAALSGGVDAYVTQNKSFAKYVSYAIQVLHEYNLVPPDVDRVTLIVRSALAAQNLFFAASLHHPERVELHQVFETFVLNCVMPPEKRNYL